MADVPFSKWRLMCSVVLTVSATVVATDGFVPAARATTVHWGDPYGRETERRQWRCHAVLLQHRHHQREGNVV
jgi:hypothetical protein